MPFPAGRAARSPAPLVVDDHLHRLHLIALQHLQQGVADRRAELFFHAAGDQQIVLRPLGGAMRTMTSLDSSVPAIASRIIFIIHLIVRTQRMRGRLGPALRLQILQVVQGVRRHQRRGGVEVPAASSLRTQEAEIAVP